MIALIQKGPVTKIKNIKTDLTKILRPTHFSRPKDIKTDRLFVVRYLCLDYVKDSNMLRNRVH